MKIVKVEHTKCDQWAKAVYFIAPNDLTEEQFQADVLAAQATYFLARDEFAKMTPKPDPWIEWANELSDTRNGITNDMTIGEAKARKAKLAEENQAWRDKRDEVSGSFESHMRERGYKTLYEASDEMLTAEADWGHHHGERLRF